MNIICNWLSERLDHSLHDVQLVALTNIMPRIYADMSLQGVCEEKLNLKSYQTIMSRLKMEEAAALAGGSLFEQPSSSIFNTSLLSSLTSSSSGSSASAQAQQPSQAQLTGQQQPGPGQALTRQASQQQRLDSPGAIQSRRFQTLGGPPGELGQEQPAQEQADNIADRALQSATRMFKGFWAS